MITATVVVIMFEAAKCGDRLGGLIAVLPLDLGTRLALGARVFFLWDVGCGMWDVGCGMWDVGCGMWDVGCGMWDVGCGMWDVGCGSDFSRDAWF
jgi:hypothetical protein